MTPTQNNPDFSWLEYGRTVLIGLLVVLLFSYFVGCAGTTIYQPVTTKNADGKASTKAVKVMAVQGDIQGAFTLTTRPGGGVVLDVKPLDASQVLMQRIAATDGKGNPLLTKDGQPIFNEIPLVAGLNHSRATAAAHDGFSKSARSIGSVAGTIAASVAGAEAANSIAGAIPR